jgi:hypothetical protein
MMRQRIDALMMQFVNPFSYWSPVSNDTERFIKVLDRRVVLAAVGRVTLIGLAHALSGAIARRTRASFARNPDRHRRWRVEYHRHDTQPSSRVMGRQHAR